MRMYTPCIELPKRDRRNKKKKEAKMLLQDYQDAALTTAVFPGQGEFLGLTYCALGLNGEAGEVADCFKKAQRDDDLKLTPERREKIKLEMGDCLWYIAVLAHQMGMTLESVAEANIEKLKSRQARGKLGGSGDFR